MSEYVPWKVVHLSLDGEIAEIPECSGYRGVYVVFWLHGVPLGHANVLAGQLPLPSSEVSRLGAMSIVSVVEHYLVAGKKFAGSWISPEEVAATTQNLAEQESIPQSGIPVDSESDKRDLPPTDSNEAIVSPARCLPAPIASPLSHVRVYLDPPNATVRPLISVIVCTRDRPHVLQRCLDSLSSQSLTPEQIIVVDNAPKNEDTYRLVTNLPGITYVREPIAGLSRARNTGLQHAVGDIVAFTDDDVLADPHWLKRVASCFVDAEVMAMTGLVLTGELHQESQMFFETHWSFNRGYTPLRYDQNFFQRNLSVGVPVWEIGAGANMAFRRVVFEKLGGFDELLGAGTSGCGEDSEVWYRILAAGYAVVYDPKALVHHFHRADMDQLKSQIYHYMRGHTVALLRQHARYGHMGNRQRALLTLPLFYLRHIVRRILRGRKSVSPTLFTEIRGWFDGLRYYRKHRPATTTAPAIYSLEKQSV